MKTTLWSLGMMCVLVAGAAHAYGGPSAALALRKEAYVILGVLGLLCAGAFAWPCWKLACALRQKRIERHKRD